MNCENCETAHIEYLKDIVVELIPLMKSEFNTYFDDVIVDVKANSIYEGSIIALFTVIWDTAKTVKDAYDIIKMVNEVSELFMRSKLKEEFENKFYIHTVSINKSDKRSR
ncbi:MAG: hypothetical protein MJ089_07455 [Ruminococcus sp.]|nr:hypothetical protein [Ruminococcus sp.]